MSQFDVAKITFYVRNVITSPVTEIYTQKLTLVNNYCLNLYDDIVSRKWKLVITFVYLAM